MLNRFSHRCINMRKFYGWMTKRIKWYDDYRRLISHFPRHLSFALMHRWNIQTGYCVVTRAPICMCALVIRIHDFTQILYHIFRYIWLIRIYLSNMLLEFKWNFICLKLQRRRLFSKKNSMGWFLREGKKGDLGNFSIVYLKLCISA